MDRAGQLPRLLDPALRDTGRVGSLAYVSNQSWQGLLARFVEPYEPSRGIWAAGVLVLLVCGSCGSAGRPPPVTTPPRSR